jgi:hypothetical protein
MDGGGLSVGGIASVGFAAGMSLPGGPAGPGAMQPANAPPPATTAFAAADVVVSISDGAMQALTLDALASVNGAAPSQFSEDLAALALLAILERDQQRDLVTAAAAISAYMAMQAMGG